MTACLKVEATTLLRYSGARGRVRSVFFGGGTPSLMRPEDVKEVIAATRSYWDGSSEVEISMEANPGDVAGRKGVLEALKDVGVGRISLGVQSFDDDRLRQINRDHSAAEAVRALKEAKRVFGADKVSADLIFGLPGHTMKEWRRELDRMLHFGLGHVSLYQLTVERGTKMWKQLEGRKDLLPDEEEVADMYNEAVEAMERAGLDRYEVSNFASGKESQCEHNKGYWRGSEYVGVGPGAHGRFRDKGWMQEPAAAERACDVIMGDVPTPPPPICSGSVRLSRVQTPDPSGWMREVEMAGHATRLSRPTSDVDFLSELLATALRTREGLSRELWRRRTEECVQHKVMSGVTLKDVINNEKCREMASRGVILLDDYGLRLSKQGLSITDHVVPYMFNCLETSVKRRLKNKETTDCQTSKCE